MTSGKSAVVASIIFAALAGSASAEISDNQANEAFRGVQYRQAVLMKSKLAVGCEDELKSGTYGEQCRGYRSAALEMLAFEDRALDWCQAKIERQVAAAGGRTDIKVNLPRACNAPSGLDERDQRISNLTAAINPAGAALAQQIADETKAAH
jgi:hypothetical protein